VTLPSKPPRYESSSQEQANERKAEEKRTERLLAILATKIGPTGERREPSSVRIAQRSGQYL
jgi:hypothetical protein